jgi:apolipoprotein D and lipocalin family protein
MTLFAVALLCLATPSIAFTGFGPCPTADAVKKLDVKSYVGLWYEIARDASITFETGDCVTAQYALQDDGKLSVKNSEVRPDGSLNSVTGSAYCQADGSGNCFVKFSRFQPWGDYRVLDTDYKTYSIVYSCSSLFGLYHFGAGWVLGRTPDVSPSLASAFAGIGIPESEMRVTSHTGCPSVVSL